MADRASALASVYRSGLHGVDDGSSVALTLHERRDLSMVLLACFPEDREALDSILRERFGLDLAEPGKASSNDEATLLWQGPDRWLLVALEAQQVAMAHSLEQALAEHPTVAVTDLSHARSVIRLSGSPARQLLCKGSGLDMEPGSFSKGNCALTRFGHYAITLHAVEEQVIDLYITRSFALALWEELLDLGAEYGLRVEKAGV